MEALERDRRTREALGRGRVRLRGIEAEFALIETRGTDNVTQDVEFLETVGKWLDTIDRKMFAYRLSRTERMGG